MYRLTMSMKVGITLRLRWGWGLCGSLRLPLVTETVAKTWECGWISWAPKSMTRKRSIVSDMPVAIWLCQRSQLRGPIILTCVWPSSALVSTLRGVRQDKLTK